MTDCEILTLVERLEQCSLSPHDFHHRDHLTVAVVYLFSTGLERALDKMRASLIRFVAHHGGNRYHETATRFWILQAEKHLDRTLCLQHAVERVIAALADKNLIYQYYSRERLDSVEAKQGWEEPDRELVTGNSKEEIAKIAGH